MVRYWKTSFDETRTYDLLEWCQISHGAFGVLAAAFKKLGAKRSISHFACRERYRSEEESDMDRLAAAVALEIEGEPDGLACGPAEIAGLTSLMKSR